MSAHGYGRAMTDEICVRAIEIELDGGRGGRRVADKIGEGALGRPTPTWLTCSTPNRCRRLTQSPRARGRGQCRTRRRLSSDGRREKVQAGIQVLHERL